MLNKRRYKVTGFTEGPIKMAIALHKVGDYGWRPVKSGDTRIRLYNKIHKK